MSLSLRHQLVWLYNYTDIGTAGRPKTRYARVNSPDTHKGWWMARAVSAGREYVVGGAKHAVEAVFCCSTEVPVVPNAVLKDEDNNLYRILAVLRSDMGLLEYRLPCVRADGAVADNLVETP